MSLELALKENTEAVRALCNLLSSAKLRIDGSDTDTVTDPDPKGVAAFKPLEGDPEGTRYWDIPKYNSVFKQGEGDANPAMESAVITTPADYLKKKAKYEALAKKAQTAGQKGEQTGANAGTPAKDSQAASTASSQKQGPSVADVTAKFMTTLKLTGKAPDSGKVAARALIDSYKKGAKFAEIITPANAAEILAKIDKLIADDAGTAEDDLDSF